MTTESNRARAQARFARAAMAVYGGTTIVAIGLLGAALYTDRTNQDEIAATTLKLTNVVRADYLARHLSMLGGELRRLGLRSEIDLLDASIEPERSLLRLSHDKSTFFNVGVAILDRGGAVAWSEPESFLARGTSLGKETWFRSVHDTRSIRIVPVSPERNHDALMYVVSPVVREGHFMGALLGAINLAAGDQVEPTPLSRGVGATSRPIVALHDGQIVYPPDPPAYANSPAWRALFAGQEAEPFVTRTILAGEEMIVALAPVHGTDLALLRLAPSAALLATSHHRFWERLALGLLLALAPNVFLAVKLRRELAIFKHSEDEALHADRMISIGEAANLIAHEVKNALNGLRLGLDLLLAGERGSSGPRATAAGALRREIEHLSEFTTELLTFSKGVKPRPVKLGLVELVERIADLHIAAATEAGIALELDLGPYARRPPDAEESDGAARPDIYVSADPQLLHVVITNLIGNAVEALGTVDGREPRAKIIVRREDGRATVTVEDNGPGVPPTLLPRLFEPFATGKPSGTGLGLALSRNIALAHGGELILADTPSGATFVFTLPLEKD